MNGVAPNMRWEDDDEAVKGLIMTSIPDEIVSKLEPARRSGGIA